MRSLTALLLLLAMPLSQAQYKGAFKGAWGETAPQLPQIFLDSNVGDLIPSPTVFKTICSSGCSYTTMQAAENDIHNVAPNCNEVITVTAGYVAQAVTNSYLSTMLTVTYPCPAGRYVQYTTSGTLPAQGSNTRTCVENGYSHPCDVNTGDESSMFQVTLNMSSGLPDGIDICGNGNVANNCPGGSGNTAQGRIFTGMFVNVIGSVLFTAVYIGDYHDTVGPSRIFFDRCIFDTGSGTYSAQMVRYFQSFGNDISVTDSYFGHLYSPNSAGTQTQVFNTYAGGHTVKFVHNFVYGAPTENFMIGGGGGGGVPALGCPSDVEVRLNTFAKDKSIISLPPTTSSAYIANDIEIKQCYARVLVEGNYFLWTFNDSPYYTNYGGIVSIKADLNADCFFCPTSDVEFRYNIVAHFNVAFSAFGHSSNSSYLSYPVTQRVRVHDNLFLDENFNTYYNSSPNVAGIVIQSGGANGAGNLGTPGPMSYAIFNNDFLGTPTNASHWATINQPNSTPAHLCTNGWHTVVPNFVMQQNLVVLDAQFEGDCFNNPSIYIATNTFPNWLISQNALFGWPQGTPPLCANFSPYNPGVCPTGAASTPTTINGDVGMTDYATCAAATDVLNSFTYCKATGGSLAITYPYIATIGPNLTAMQTAMAYGNDYAGYGIPRQVF